jgi:hypothetical protein
MKQLPPLHLGQVLRIVFEDSFHSPSQLDETEAWGEMLLASGLHAEFRAASFLSWGLSTNHSMCYALGSHKHSFLWFKLV